MATLKYGSQGSDVKDLQTKLNAKGYNLSVDGIFGKNTLSAVQDFQRKNKLAVDGIVGPNTTTALADGGGAPTGGYTPTATPTLKPSPTNPAYDSTSFWDSEIGKGILGDYTSLSDLLANFKASNDDLLTSVKGELEEYPDFSYDVNSDALYQQYAEQYARMGKLAAQDVMGQAAAMTGGYGNSYATTAGNQAYQSYLQQLNDRVPELYQLAYDRHKTDKQDLYNEYNMLMSERDKEYNALVDRIGTEMNMYYSDQSNKNGVLAQEFTDAMNVWANENTNAWQQAQWEESLNQYANEEAWRNKEWNAAIAGNGGGTGGKGGNGGNGGNTTTAQVSDDIISAVKNYKTEQGQADYLAKMVNDKVIDENQALDILNQYGVTDLTNRNWEMVDDGGWNWFGLGIDTDARVRDEHGNEYSLGELRKELQKTMTLKEANAWIKKLEEKLDI